MQHHFLLALFSVSNTPEFNVVSGVSLKIQDAVPMINSTNAILPATGYVMTVFTVSGGRVLECFFRIIEQ